MKKLMLTAYGAAVVVHEIGVCIKWSPFFLIGATAMTLSCLKNISNLSLGKNYD